MRHEQRELTADERNRDAAREPQARRHRLRRRAQEHRSEYSSVGGWTWEGTEREVVFQQSVFSRTGTVRIMKFAFDLARAPPRKRVTSATKSNGIWITIPYWDERFKAWRRNYPTLPLTSITSTSCARTSSDSRRYSTSSDILSNLGPAVCGAIGIAPSAHINPEWTFPSLFEPVQ